MKWVVFIFTLFVLPDPAMAQDTVDIDIENYKFLKDSTESYIGQGCGNSGRTSTNLYCIRYLIHNKRYDLIVKSLDSKTASTRYIAALTLIHAEKKSLYKADSVTKALLDTLRHDNSTIQFCFGCTVHYKSTISLLLDEKNENIGVKYWIVDCFRKRSRGYD